MSDLFENLEKPFNLLNEQAFEANRRGEILPAQQKQLTSAVAWYRIILLVISMLAIGAIPGFLLFSVILSGEWHESLFPVFFICGIFGVFLLFIGYGVWRQVSKALKLRRDFANRAIRLGQGQLAYRKKGYIFEMSGISLRLPA